MPKKCSAGKRESDKDLVYLSDEAPAEKPWDKHRNDADKVESLYFSAKLDWMQRYSDRIAKCADVLDFGLVAVKGDEGEYRLKLKRTFFCRVRHCPVCQWRRAMRWQARMIEALPHIESDYPSYRWVFLTLTVKNCEITELRKTLNLINSAFRRLTQRKNWPAIGWVKSVEVTYHNDYIAHPHIHCLMLVKPSYFSKYYITQEEWTELWKKSAKLDYLPIVDVRAVRSKSLSDETIQNAISETVKYSVKPDDLTKSAIWLHSLTEQLRRTRAISIGGILKAYLGESDSQPEETLDISETNPGGIRFNWYRNAKKNKKTGKVEGRYVRKK